MHERMSPLCCCIPEAETSSSSVYAAKTHQSFPYEHEFYASMPFRQVAEEPATNRRRGKKMSSPERWEVTQLIKSGVLDVTEYPDFDDENGQVRSHHKGCLTDSEGIYAQQAAHAQCDTAVLPAQSAGLQEVLGVSCTVG